MGSLVTFEDRPRSIAVATSNPKNSVDIQVDKSTTIDSEIQTIEKCLSSNEIQTIGLSLTCSEM